MKKLFLYAGLFSSHLFGFDYTNKNIMTMLAPGKDLFMKDLGWSEIQRDLENKRNCFGTVSVQTSFFYSKMLSRKKIGAYFGLKEKNSFTFKGGKLSGADFDSSSLIHDAIYDGYRFQLDLITSTPGPFSDQNLNINSANQDYEDSIGVPRALSGELTLMPEQQIWGMITSIYFAIQPNMWLDISIPAIKIKQWLSPQVEERKFKNANSPVEGISILDILSGAAKPSKTNIDNPNQQSPLNFAKISQEKLDKLTMGDPDITFGYRILNDERFDCDAFVRISVPIAEKVDPEYLFNPQIGNNGHAGLGVGIKGSLDVAKDYNGLNLEVTFGSNVNYWFGASELRTLNSYSDRGIILPWQKYMLAAQINKASAMEPIANITTTDVDVFPGFSGETYINLCVKHPCFFANLGFSTQFKQAEKINRLPWAKDGLYGTPSTFRYRTDQIYDPKTFPFGEIDTSSITASELDLSSASTPGFVANTIFAQVNYYEESDKKPFFAGLGLGYQFSNENSCPDKISVWLKLGIAF